MLESSALAGVDAFPRIRLGHLPTPLDAAPNLGAALGIELWIKRDDCTGLAFGGNKVRQLEFYLGEAQASGETVPVHGICVRRKASRQRPRVERRAAELAAMIGCAGVVRDHDIDVCDAVLAPGYGRLSDAVGEAMSMAARLEGLLSMAARLEGLLLDPVYTGKVMAGLVAQARSGRIEAGSRVLFLHSGGTPALFGYAHRLEPWLSPAPELRRVAPSF